jgi:hypothetical protein
MKSIYEQLRPSYDRLAELLLPLGESALEETVERPTATIIEFPHQMQLCDPPEAGWERRPTPPEAA